MTVQAERPIRVAAEVPPRRRKRAVAAAFVVIAVVAAAAVTFGIRDHSGRPQPNPALGQSLQPLAAYRVEISGNISKGHASTKVVPDLGRPGHTTLLDNTPTFSLHVQYAHVRQVAGR